MHDRTIYPWIAGTYSNVRCLCYWPAHWKAANAISTRALPMGQDSSDRELSALIEGVLQRALDA